MTEKIPLIDDPARMESEAYQKGLIAADRGFPRECEFFAENLRAKWFVGYDDRAPKSWVLPRERPWTKAVSIPGSAGVPLNPDIKALRAKLKGVLAL